MSLLGFVDESHLYSSSTSRKKNKSLLNKSGSKKTTPRPKNSFILYRQDKQKLLPLSRKKILSKEFSKIASEMWKNETEEVRRYYDRLAELEKLRHIEEFPSYKYNPQKKKKNRTENKEYQNLPPIETVNEHAEIQTTFKLNEENDISCPSILPSSMVPELQIFPGGSDMDFLSYDNNELFTLLSAIFQY